MIIAMTNIRVIVVELIINQLLICRIENMPKQYLKLSIVDVQKYPNIQIFNLNLQEHILCFGFLHKELVLFQSFNLTTVS